MNKLKTKNGDAQKKQSSCKVREVSPEAGRESRVGKICERGRRRGGELTVTWAVEDLLTVLTSLDENLKLNELPCYVTNKPDSMPSARLYEGNMAAIMKIN